MTQTYLRAGALLLLSCAAVSPLRAQAPAAAASSQPSTPGSTIIQRVLVRVNGEVFTQKDLEEQQIDALQKDGKNNLQGEALNKAVSDLMPDLLVEAIDAMLLLQRGRELGYHMS